MITILGNGIYSIPDSARLLGVSGRRVHAWFYSWPRGSSAILHSDYTGIFPTKCISFLDLVDAAVAATLIQKHNFSHHKLRKLWDRMSTAFDTVHPFARKELYADAHGRELFYNIAVEDEPVELVDAMDQQRAFPEVLLPFLDRVEYNGDSHFAQVFPLMGNVVLDPRRKYGTPTVRGTGMATSILYECYKANSSEDAVADWYNVTPEDVREAIAFETGYAGIAA